MTQDEWDLAAQVHYSFLPEDFSNGRVDITVAVHPYSGLGGDYCSILPIDEHHIIVCMCDAVGHGVASALYAARINTFVQTHALQQREPCNIMDELNAYLCQRLAGTGMYASFCALLLDLEVGEVKVASAAHPPVLLFQAEKKGLLQLASATTFLGVSHPMPLMCGVDRIVVGAGDRLVLYSDGLIEVKDTADVMWGVQGLEQAVRSNAHLAKREFNDQLLAASSGFSSAGAEDDILLLTIDIK